MDIDIKPKEEVLRSLGWSEADFNHALVLALDRLDGKPLWDLPVPRDIPILWAGHEHRLGDLARIDVTFTQTSSGSV